MGIPFSVLYIFQNLFELDVTVWKAEIFLNVIYIDNLHAKIIFVILAWCKYGI